MKLNYNLLMMACILLGIGQAWGQGFEYVYPEPNAFTHFRSGKQTADLGYVFFGNHGGDFYVVKTDAYGIVQWTNTNVMPQYEEDHDIIQMQDGGYLAVGKTQEFYGGHIVRYDANGSILWQRSMPNDGNGGSYGAYELADQTFMIWGSSSGPGTQGGYDALLTKHDAQGNLIWSKFYPNPVGWDQGREIHQTPDGGFILSGYKSNSNFSDNDLWLMKVDANGNMQWEKVFDWGGNNFLDVHAMGVLPTDDGGYLASGSPGDSGPLHLYKTDGQGNLQWSSQIGAAGDEFWGWVIKAHNGGYMAIGTSSRFGNGSKDVFMVKISSTGQEQWHRIYGGDQEDRGRCIRPTADGGYILSGDSRSFNQAAQREAYALKVDSLGRLGVVCDDTPIDVYPQICTGDAWTVGSHTYNQTGTYTDTLASVFGCDSIVITHLTVGNQIHVTLNQQICVGDDFTVGTSTYNTSGTYVDTLTASFGCDSVVTTHLSVVNTIQTNLTPVICSGEGFTVGSNTYTSTGSYVDYFTSDFGCDSIVTTTLFVIPEHSGTNNITICEGESYVVGNSVYTESGTYTDMMACQMGCDSIVTTNLTVIPTHFEITTEICPGESFTVGSSTYTESGTYMDTLMGSSGCDSIITTVLEVLPSRDTIINRRICEGDWVLIGNSWNPFYEEGTYTINLTAQNGCDSVITLNLTVYPNYHETINATICEGETFTVGTYTHTESGTYDDHFYAEGVCDSLITVNLTVLEGADTTIEAFICPGESFTVGSSTYSETGVYEDVFALPNGCDSVVTTHLTVGYGQDAQGNPLAQIIGNVFKDNNDDCILDGGDTPITNWVVEAENGSSTYGTTDSTGQYSILVPYGTYNVSTQTPGNWMNCGQSPQSVSIDPNTGCSAEVDLPLIPEYECALLDIDLSIICLVPCSTSTYHLNYHNIGTATAYDPVLSFVAGPFVTVNWSSVPWLNPQSGNVYEFHLDSVPAGASGWIAITVTVDCNQGLEGLSVCSGASHDASQCCENYELYSGAQIELEAQCIDNDTVEFKIKNTGSGNMADNLNYFILQDDIVYAVGSFFLPAQGEEIIQVPADGRTYRLEAEQEPFHPYLTAPAIVVEGCGTNSEGLVSLGFSDVLDNGDDVPSVDFLCTAITEDCSCNQLYGSPYGFDVQHYVSNDDQLEYTITFQNQGMMVSEDLVIIDTLPAELDPMTVIRGEASHDFEFFVYDGGIVKWILNDINLEPGMPGTMENSGFVKFKANLKPGLASGTVVTNMAYLHFDGGQGSPTNEVFHTVGERSVDFLIPLAVDDIKNPDHSLNVFPNPFTETTTLEITGVNAKQIYVEIHDVAGQLVQTNVATNQHVVQISRTGLADGVYTYRVIADGLFIGTGKLVIGTSK